MEKRLEAGVRPSSYHPHVDFGDEPDLGFNVNRTGDTSSISSASATFESTELSGDEAHFILDGGYGWVNVLCVFVVFVSTWGVVASYAVCLAHYLNNKIFPEATVVDYAFIGGLNFSMAMVVASPVTILTRNLGVQIPMLMGVVLQTGGFIIASYSKKIWTIYLSQGVLVGFGVGFLFIPSITVIPEWFTKKRSLANGLASAGAGVGGLIFAHALDSMIWSVGLPWALRVVGITSGVLNLVATAFTRSRRSPTKPKMRAFDLSLLQQPKVILLLGWSFMSMFGFMTVLFSMPDFSRSIGLSSKQMAASAMILNAGTALGRPFIGVLSDRFGRIEVAGTITFFCGLCIFTTWIPAQEFAITALFCVLSGPMIGVFWATIGPLCAEVVGLRDTPSALSLCWCTIALPTGFAEVIALKLRRSPDQGREYLCPQVFAGMTFVAASVFILMLWVRHRRPRCIACSLKVPRHLRPLHFPLAKPTQVLVIGTLPYLPPSLSVSTIAAKSQNSLSKSIVPLPRAKTVQDLREKRHATVEHM
ncbi:major facilitator superfamily domain-containing protein [Lineolata rhizophorae]|uniref:Major facilitator superfamily domain-containing protein n=1 Tax=Lineolata rhizophorae TaxID=578093 RepID=A0A6A6P224_9PEZI|nr:major facilitator superfamily domain-containing protein [Lineolata rhizophorae]